MAMAAPNCWRCLARPSQRLLRPASIAVPTISAPFTTSAAQLAKEDTGISRHVRTGKKLVLGKKKKRPEPGKPVGPGERKAFRKRIVLRNDNALEVPGLSQLNARTLVDPAMAGSVVGIPEHLIDQLRTVEAFKPTQNWGLFRDPHTLVRKETVDFLQPLVQKVQNKETVRTVIAGAKGTGKSILGLQALSAGFLNKWVVINIPEGQDLTMAITDYSEIPKSEMFSQPSYILKLMQAIHNANKDILSKLTIALDHPHLPFTVSRGMTLAALANATREPDFAWPAFYTLWQELLAPGRPPIMFNLDGLSHIMRVSNYRSPAFDPIHSHDLGVVRLFADALGGKTKFPNGAAIIGVMTKSNCPKLESVELALRQARAAQALRQARAAHPGPVQAYLHIPRRFPLYRKYDNRVFEALNNVSVFDVKGVSKPEARALMEYWAASGILPMRIDGKGVSERWTLAGSGVIAEMERASLFAVRL